MSLGRFFWLLVCVLTGFAMGLCALFLVAIRGDGVSVGARDMSFKDYD